MTTTEFQYKGDITTIPAEGADKFMEICSKFTNKINVEITTLNFIYSGTVINLGSTLNQTISRIDKERKLMRILVFDAEVIPESQSLVKSPYIICPTCKEQARFEMINYRIKISGCKNRHVNDNILLKDFEKTQFIDESKIKCDNCKIKNKSNSFNKEMHVCNKCNMNLCPHVNLIMIQVIR